MYNLISVDLPLFVGSTFLFALMASSDQLFSRGEALILVIGYIVYLFYILKSSDDEAASSVETELSQEPLSASQFLRQGFNFGAERYFYLFGSQLYD